MLTMGELWATLGSVIASVMFASAIFRQHFPHQLWGYVEKYSFKLVRFFYPYIEIRFDEFSGDRMKRSEAFSAIQNYLSTKASLLATRFKADFVKDSQSLILSMEDKEEVTDEFEGVKVWWVLVKTAPRTQQFSFYPAADEKRFYKLTFHESHREIITAYVKHVLDEGKAIAVKDRQRKLFSNNSSESWHGWRQRKWSHVQFEHPATLDTLAMETTKKEEIKKDLLKFREGKEYYKKIGKAWKRGYLLYGPPGTGKSTMIAAMANFLNYDVYDLELTTVKDNSQLRSLLIETTNKSIIVIEDIDCLLDLTGQWEKKKEKDEDKEEKNPVEKKMKEEGENKASKVTLSGLLNFIDGLWSACGGERLIVFTTNYLDKLDPALIRRGRMDKHIEMSYCGFEAFKVLAKNYLDIVSHELFAEVGSQLAETNMTPADVAENLMPKSDDDDTETCLKNLIEALKVAKEEAIKKAEEEARLKAEKEEEEEGKKKCADFTEENKKGNESSANSVKKNGSPDKEVKQ
ncbi:AAA-ATPase At3g28580-like isoform X1 [Mangifera indica]|uniref:AAA-ATPase At3g28580-like isoform X1 n=1 Tax=Mangifera indica TaxID=29780 RepID=UPI001CFA0C5A|nr:AAA-ATPase At3g28580-like isoform X1 [Mangifera indica]XP_044480218.1 AAA-ATPase At3g28580-like isoform X1 [Mangifera indica]